MMEGETALSEDDLADVSGGICGGIIQVQPVPNAGISLITQPFLENVQSVSPRCFN